MRVDNSTISDMFDVLHDEIVGGGAPEYIEFLDSSEVVLCRVPFSDVVKDPSISSDFYFEDTFGTRVIRGVVGDPGSGGTVSSFKIYDAVSNPIITGIVTLLNGGGDIVFNTLEWVVGQVVIISSLKIYFPTES